MNLKYLVPSTVHLFLLSLTRWYFSGLMKWTSLWGLVAMGGVSPRMLLMNVANLRLRTKLLVSFVLLSAGLTFATLIVVRQSARVQVQHQVEQDARNAILTFQAMEGQQQIALSRKADLPSSISAGQTTARRAGL